MTLDELGSLSPGIWGHSGWKFLFAIASVYSEDSASPLARQRFYSYFTSLAHVLPCQMCRKHYQEYLQNKPISFYLENQHTLFQWLLGLHNKSNPDKMLLSKEHAIRYYLESKNYSKKDPRDKTVNKQKKKLAPDGFPTLKIDPPSRLYNNLPKNKCTDCGST